MFSFEIVNPPTSFRLRKKDLKTIFHAVESEVDLLQNGVINIAFLSDDQIHYYNRVYRSIDSTTDVLSFHYFDDFSGVEKDEVAGEIILSEPKVIAQAIEHGHTTAREAHILILHGLLHILGFDHETEKDYKKMWKHEEKLRKNIEI